MSASAAIADPLLRRASGHRARPSGPQGTARVRLGSSGQRVQVSRLSSPISRWTVMNHVGLVGKLPCQEGARRLHAVARITQEQEVQR